MGGWRVATCVGVAACGTGGPGALPPERVFDRVEAGTVPPDCNLASACPDAVVGLDPSLCITDGSPFALEIDDDTERVIDAKVDDAAIAALALAPGRWWATFGGPDCGAVLTVIVPVAEPEILEVADAP
jgi:hypothetical protein